MLRTTWQGLAQKPTLTKLTIKFPNDRTPRPIATAPPLLNLQYLKITEIDPLCYPDDVSLLLLGSKNLRHLKLHWSSRMRDNREPSVHSGQLFGRMMASNYVMPLKSLSIQNLYIHHGESCMLSLDTIEELTLINSTSGLGNDGSTAFMDGTYRKPEGMVLTVLKSLRVDRVSHQLCEFLTHITGLEKLYLIGPQPHPHRSSSKDQSNDTTPLPCSPDSTNSSSGSIDINHIVSLKDDYIEAITQYHGKTLRHLLLLPQWRLTDEDIATIVRQCPNLEQLGIGADFSNFKNLRLLVPFLSNLTSMRLLGNPDDASFVNKMREMDDLGIHEEKIGEETVNGQWSKLSWMELGADDLIFEVGKRESGKRELRERDGRTGWRRKVAKRPFKMVEGIDIWRMDSLDI